VTDDDHLTNGEIGRAIARLEGEDRSLAVRLTNLAAEMVPAKLWEAEHRALTDRLIQHEKGADADRKRLEKAIGDVEVQVRRIREDQEKRSDVTWQKITGLVVALATIAGVLVALASLSGGIH
jgi:signal transduction protein with GAF and PtsI domain